MTAANHCAPDYSPVFKRQRLNGKNRLEAVSPQRRRAKVVHAELISFGSCEKSCGSSKQVTNPNWKPADLECLIFFGCVPVVLSPVEGEATMPPSSWQAVACTETERRARATSHSLTRKAPLSYLGVDYSSVVVPAVPALDWEPAAEVCSSEDYAFAKLPQCLAKGPFLKVPVDCEAAAVSDAMDGVASGARSAIVQVNGRWWRLKGCGKFDQGFPIETTAAAVKSKNNNVNIPQNEKDLQAQTGHHSRPDLLTVRGCVFEHTAHAEIRITQLVTKVLNKAGHDVANCPAGLYRYSPEPSWALPKIERCCVVLETMGNARLGCHLLAGLLRLLPLLVPATSDDFASLRAALDTGRGVEPADLWPTHLLAECGVPTVDVAGQLMQVGIVLDERAPPLAKEVPPGGEYVCPPFLIELWDKARTGLATRLEFAKVSSGESSLLLWLAWRLGWECGTIVRALHVAEIAWGTYFDNLGLHCNAHADNLVVKPAHAGQNETFLAALDFDMSFTRENYLPEASSTPPELGLDSWAGLLQFEANMGMKNVLAGYTISNTGAVNTTTVADSHLIVEMALRDTLVSAYDAAYRGGIDAHPENTEMRAAAYELIKLALCLTTHVMC